MKAPGYILFCALCAAYVLWSAWLAQSAVDTVDRGIRPLGALNYEHPEGPVYLENDSYYWLLMAERMRDEGVLRIRWTEADNVPFGRPVYWSQSIAWMINFLGALPPFRYAASPLVAASFWVNPFIEVATICGLVILLAPLGWKVTTMSVALFTGMGDVSWAFSSLRPDHQSLQAAFWILMFAALFREGFGFARPCIDGEVVRHGSGGGQCRSFAFAGVCAGLGLWVSAAAFMPVLIVMATAVCAVALLQQSCAPAEWAGNGGRCWIAWGVAAGVVSLLFWLIEFFPSLGNTRLEANNPAFSIWVVLLGCGAAVSAGLGAHSWKQKWRSFVMLLAITLLCLVLPAAILFGPTSWYWPRDASMDRLHNFIMEFYTFANYVKKDFLFSLWRYYNVILPLGALLVVPAWKWREKPSRAALLVVFLVLCGLFVMSMRQIRWLALFAPVLALAAGVCAAFLSVAASKVNKWGRWLSAIVIAGFFVQVAILTSREVIAMRAVLAGRSLLNEIVPAVLNKHFAASLASLPKKPAAVMADPNLVPALYYFARIPCVISFYWENLEGARDAALFFADTGPMDAAKEVAARRRLSHVIVPSGRLFPNYFYFIKHGHYDTEQARQTLAWKLTEGSVLSLPPWLAADKEVDRIGKVPYAYKGQAMEQYLNVYRIDLDKAGEAAQ